MYKLSVPFTYDSITNDFFEIYVRQMQEAGVERVFIGEEYELIGMDEKEFLESADRGSYDLYLDSKQKKSS